VALVRSEPVSNEVQVLTQLLSRYISPVNARALVLRALKDHGVSPTSPSHQEIQKCNGTIRQGVELFVSPTRKDDVFRELTTFFGADAQLPEACTIPVRSEPDVGVARSEARRLCTRAGADPFTMQKVTTIVSELARNIVLYATQGTIELRPQGRRLTIRASDHGPGIPNLDHILSGQYKSKTGLGRGILGVRRLSERFEITTGKTGTKIMAEVAL
jgi:serine/threonine-protein kinase RsbT